MGYIYEVKELDVDGCGSEVVVYIQSEHEFTQEQYNCFNNCLTKAQNYVKENNEDWDTQDRVEYALELFNNTCGTNASLCNDPFAAHFSF